MDSTRHDRQVSSSDNRQNDPLRSRLEALRNGTMRPCVKEENEVVEEQEEEREKQAQDVTHEQGFYPEIKYQEPTVGPAYL